MTRVVKKRVKKHKKKPVEHKKVFHDRTVYYLNANKKTIHRDNDLPAIISKEGDKYWYVKGKHFRENDQPNTVFSDGTKHWYDKSSYLHRLTGPAIEHTNGTVFYYIAGQQYSRKDFDEKVKMINASDKEELFKVETVIYTAWYKDSKRNILHRDGDLPALEYKNGEKEWYKNGKPHRDNNLPAWEGPNGTKVWFKEGKRHCLTGPAYICGDRKEYWIEGVKLINEEAFNMAVKKITSEENSEKEINMKKEFKETKINGDVYYYLNDKKTTIHRGDDLPAVECKNGHKEWYVKGKLHRDGDKPAIIYTDGELHYYKSGKSHRDGDKPAIVAPGCYERWYKNDKIHRDGDLPAAIFEGGRKEWYKNGKQHRDNGLPAYEDNEGRKIWYVNGKLHRDGDLPAIVDKVDGNEWWEKGKRHRIAGPAIVRPNGKEEYWIKDTFMTKELWEKKVAKLKPKKWYQSGLLHREGDKPAVDAEIKNIHLDKLPDEIKTNSSLTIDHFAHKLVKPNAKDMLKSSMIAGAKRNATHIMVTTVLAAVKHSLPRDGKLNETILTFLDTPIAVAFIQSVIGFMGPQVPQLAQNKYATILMEECRHQSMEKSQKEILDKAMEYVVPALIDALKSLNDDPALRVADDVEVNEENLVEEMVGELAQIKA